ncbi:MAG: capsular exopolysaccharide family [Conexibacter sp.]|nr:capsular exopolysaccharide family [Conexibacter sp.]
MTPRTDEFGFEDTGADDRTTSPFELFRVIWRRRVLVVLVVILCILVSVLLVLRTPKEYTSSASLLFRDPGFARTLYGNGLFDAGQDPKRATQTNLDVVHSTNVAVQARKLLRTDESAGSLLNSVTVTPGSDSDVATVEAKRPTPADAAQVANAFADAYIAYRQATDRAAVQKAQDLITASLTTAAPDERTGLLTSLRQLEVLKTLQTGNAEVVARASADDTPTSPKPKRDAIFGFIVGLLAGCGLALLVDYLDRRLQTEEDVERAYADFPVVATVPEDRAGSLLLEPAGRTGESYRMLREGLRFLDPDRSVRCIVVTSADESEGKSTVARHLAVTLAAVGQDVILLEADMRRPTAGAMLGVDPGAPGFSDVLASDEPAVSHLVTPLGRGSTLDVLPGGTVPPNPADLLRTGRANDVLVELREAADIVIIDAPPLIPVADTRVLLQLPQVDAVILVGRVGTTRRDRAREARRVLLQSGRRVLGLVVTGTTDSLNSSYYSDGPASGPKSRRDRLAGLLR